MARTMAATRYTATPHGRSLFRRTFEAMMGARERQARRYVRHHLLALDDAALEALGHDRRALMAGEDGPTPFV